MIESCAECMYVYSISRTIGPREEQSSLMWLVEGD